MVGVINYFYKTGIYIRIRTMMLTKYKFLRRFDVSTLNLRGFDVSTLNMAVTLLCNWFLIKSTQNSVTYFTVLLDLTTWWGFMVKV